MTDLGKHLTFLRSVRRNRHMKILALGITDETQEFEISPEHTVNSIARLLADATQRRRERLVIDDQLLELRSTAWTCLDSVGQRHGEARRRRDGRLRPDVLWPHGHG